MKTFRAILCLLFFLCLIPSSLYAQQDDVVPVTGRRPTARALLFGIGRTRQLDTYLSPMNYTGIQASFLASGERMTHLLDSCVSFQSSFFGAFTSTDNPANTANYLGGRLDYHAGWHYNYSPLRGLNLKCGALLGADVGFLYNSRNGNNPAQGRLSLDISLSAGVEYRMFIRRLPLRFAYQADLPMIGMMFSPEFGESYSEISQTGVGHDIICAHPGNAFSARQLVTLDFCLPRTTLRIGYLCDARQSNARHLKYSDVSHSFMLGFVRHFQLMKRSKS